MYSNGGGADQTSSTGDSSALLLTKQPTKSELDENEPGGVVGHHDQLADVTGMTSGMSVKQQSLVSILC